MSMTWLANADSETFWPHQTWTSFDRLERKAECVAILPIHGFAEHSLGIPLDSEEVVGQAILRRAVESAKSSLLLRVLAPLRFALGPYPTSLFEIDPETAHDLIGEIAASVKAAGFGKLLFFNTSPWNEELVDAASRDSRAALDLQTFVVNLSGLELGLHPAATAERSRFQAVASHLLGNKPKISGLKADISDSDFRPGRYRTAAELKLDKAISGAEVLASAAHRLSMLLAEIHARAPLGSRAASISPRAVKAFPPELKVPEVGPSYRSRYLTAFTLEELKALPNKKRAVVLITTGAIEQHGPHMPVGVDAIMGQAWLNLTLPKISKDIPIYVAPAITYGKSNEHIGFPGTVWISAKTLRRILLSIAAQLKDLGFRTLAIVNTHGGNSAVLVYTLREIQEKYGLRAGMVTSGYRPEMSQQESTYGFHAGEWETSAMLEVTENLVDMKSAVCEFPAHIDDPGELRPEDAPAIFSWITADVSSSGVMGDATIASQEKGRRWMDEASTMLAEKIEALVKPPIRRRK